MRNILKLTALFMALFFSISGCAANTEKRYTYNFLDTFDTVITLTAYTNSQESFDQFSKMAHEEFLHYHQLFDIYHSYENSNNVYTINENAGVKPVKVDREIIDLLLYTNSLSKTYTNKVDIAVGALTDIWHRYREDALNGKGAKVPPMEELKAVKPLLSREDIIIDENNSTVFLKKKGMKLDLGAIAKGYATEKVCESLKKNGLVNFIISAGGNVEVAGTSQKAKPEKWGVGISSPDGSSIFDVCYLSDLSAVTSGDYQRYYTVSGVRYSHIVDPDTLMPVSYFRSVTIFTKDSGYADFLSTAAYLMPFEESKKFIESIDGVDAFWILDNGESYATEGIRDSLKSNGATAAISLNS